MQILQPRMPHSIKKFFGNDFKKIPRRTNPVALGRRKRVDRPCLRFELQFAIHWESFFPVLSGSLLSYILSILSSKKPNNKNTRLQTINTEWWLQFNLSLVLSYAFSGHWLLTKHITRLQMNHVIFICVYVSVCVSVYHCIIHHIKTR